MFYLGLRRLNMGGSVAFSQPTDLGFSFASSYSKCHSLQRSNVFHIVSSCFIVFLHVSSVHLEIIKIQGVI